LADHLLPDRVIFLGQLGYIAMIGLQCFVLHVFKVSEVRKVTMYSDGL
jgi:hypothetical protein